MKLINKNSCSFLLSDEFLSLRGRFYFIKEIKKLVPRALLSHISTREFLRTLEKCEKHSPSARASPHFSRVLKNSRVLI